MVHDRVKMFEAADGEKHQNEAHWKPTSVYLHSGSGVQMIAITPGSFRSGQWSTLVDP